MVERALRGGEGCGAKWVAAVAAAAGMAATVAVAVARDLPSFWRGRREAELAVLGGNTHTKQEIFCMFCACRSPSVKWDQELLSHY